MDILIFAVIVLVVAAVAIIILRDLIPEYAKPVSLIVLLVALLVILNRAGYI